MQRIFQSFVDALTDGIDSKSLHSALAEVAEAFDLPLFAYFSVPIGLKAASWLVSNYAKDWTDQYLANRYDRVDPVISLAGTSDEPFVWGESLTSSNRSELQERFFDEASSFGIRWGYTIPIRERRTEVAALTFAADGPAPTLERSIDLHGRVLQLMAVYFHRHARRLLGTARIVDGVALTKRELECLEWAARGKAARDIGQILDITRRTAAFHLDNARAKLNVRSIQQAVAILGESRSQR